MEHPFFDFVMLIGNDAAQLRAFLDDPDAAPLTAPQREALLSGEFGLVEKLLLEENPDAAELADGPRPDGTLAAGPLQIGWNMAPLMGEIKARNQAEA